MNKNKELVKNTAIISVGKMCTQFFTFLLLPLYTAFLSTEEYGAVDLVSSYVQLLIPIVTLQMDQAIFRFLIDQRKNKKETSRIISSALILLMIQMLVLTIVYCIAMNFIYNDYAIYLYITVVVTGLSNFVLQTARGFGNNLTYSVASFICGFLTVLLNVLLVAGLHMKAEGMLFSTIIGNIVAFLYVFIKEKLFSYVHIYQVSKQTIQNIIIYSIPLVPNAIIWWIVNASDRTIVLFFLGASANGVLAIANKFPALITTVYNIFHISWTESAALHLKDADKDIFFSNVFDTVYRIFIAFALCLISVMPLIFDIVIDTSYSGAYYLIPINTVAAIFNVIVGLYSVVYISEMKTKEVAKTSILSAVINIIVHLSLIKFIGLYAAAISSACAFGAMSIYRAIDIRKYIKQKIHYKTIISSLIVIVGAMICYYVGNRIQQVAVVGVCLVYSIYINRQLIKTFVKRIILEIRGHSL